MELSHGILVEKRYDRVTLKKDRIELAPPFEVDLNLSGYTLIKEIGKEVRVEELEGNLKRGDLTQRRDIAFLDYQELQFPLKMRNFRPGDRFQPLGVKGHQKLKEFFIDHKVPRFERAKVPLLISGEKIVWVVGHRISEQVKVTEHCKRILKVEVKNAVL